MPGLDLFGQGPTWTRVTPIFDDDDLLTSCELRGHSGTKLKLGRYDTYAARLAIMRAAQQALAGRSAGA
jgi:hypothetical protein